MSGVMEGETVAVGVIVGETAIVAVGVGVAVVVSVVVSLFEQALSSTAKKTPAVGRNFKFMFISD